jgi:hypothetical protein
MNLPYIPATLNQKFNGDVALDDELEDGPLVTLNFYAEAKDQLSEDAKLRIGQAMAVAYTQELTLLML